LTADNASFPEISGGGNTGAVGQVLLEGINISVGKPRQYHEIYPRGHQPNQTQDS
jgi:hypothetical protein